MNDKIQLAAMGAEMAEQQQLPMCMAKRIEELEAQVRVMAGLLREARKYVTALGKPDDEVSAVQMTVSRIDAALAGKLPALHVPEGWQLEDLDNDCIVVRKDGVGFYVASFNAENIASTILHALASDMLAAAPRLEPKP